MNMASKCISKLALFLPPKASPILHDHSFNYIPKFSRLWCGEMAERSCHPEGLGEKGQCVLEAEHRKWVRGYDGVPRGKEQHKVRGSMKSRQECVRNPTNCKDLRKLSKMGPSPLSPYLFATLLWLYLCQPPTGSPLLNWTVTVRNRFSRHNGLQVHPYILSIGVSRCSSNYTPMSSVGRLSIYIYFESHGTYMPYYDVVNLVTVIMMNLINEIPCSCRTPRTTALRIRHQVTCRAAQRSQLLSKSAPVLHSALHCPKLWLS